MARRISQKVDLSKFVGGLNRAPISLWGLLRVKRLDKELAKAEADIKRVDAKLANEKFVANALEEIVEEEKEKREAGTTALICPSGKNLSSPGCKNIPLRV